MRGVAIGFRGRRYTCGMDRVRFGRALGYGARHAAKTLVSAVDAATTPNPNPPGQAAQPASTQQVSTQQVSTQQGPAQPEHVLRQAVEMTRHVAAAKRQAKTHARGAFAGFWTQLKHSSGVVWLQVTGTFFALFALFMGEGVWKLRADFRSSPATPAAHRLYFYTAVFLVFLYFAVSSFVRARRREKL